MMRSSVLFVLGLAGAGCVDSLQRGKYGFNCDSLEHNFESPGWGPGFLDNADFTATQMCCFLGGGCGGGNTADCAAESSLMRGAAETSTTGDAFPAEEDFEQYASAGWPGANDDDVIVPRQLWFHFDNCPTHATDGCEHKCSSPQVFYTRMCASHVGGACSEPWCEEAGRKLQADMPLCRCPNWPQWKMTYSQTEANPTEDA